MLTAITTNTPGNGPDGTPSLGSKRPGLSGRSGRWPGGRAMGFAGRWARAVGSAPTVSALKATLPNFVRTVRRCIPPPRVVNVAPIVPPGLLAAAQARREGLAELGNFRRHDERAVTLIGIALEVVLVVVLGAPVVVDRLQLGDHATLELAVN